MEDEIKRCPFCGGEAEAWKVPEEFAIVDDEWIIGCDGIRGNLCPGYRWKMMPVYITRELAVRMWNGRSEE